jgi:hypothetical protein
MAAIQTLLPAAYYDAEEVAAALAESRAQGVREAQALVLSELRSLPGFWTLPWDLEKLLVKHFDTLSSAPPEPDKLAGLRDVWWKRCEKHSVHNCGEDTCKLDAFDAAIARGAGADKMAGLRDILNGDGSLALEAGNLDAIAWHLEQGKDNGKISREALALFLRAVATKLKMALAALEASR